MQRNDFVTKICEIATKFSYPVAKLRLDFFVNFEPCKGRVYSHCNCNKENKQTYLCFRLAEDQGK